MGTRLERLLRIDAIIRSGSFPNAERLSSLLEVKPRTVFQDIKELRELFALDIRFDRQRGGYFNNKPDERLPVIALGDDEAILLILGCELLYHFGGDSFRGVLAPAIVRVLGEKAYLAGKISELVEFQGSTNPASASLVVDLLRLSHVTPGGFSLRLLQSNVKKTIDLAAAKLILKDGEWFVTTSGNGDGTEESFPLHLVSMEQK